MEQRFAGEIGMGEEAEFPRRSSGTAVCGGNRKSRGSQIPPENSGMAICGGMALFMQQSPGSRESEMDTQ